MEHTLGMWVPRQAIRDNWALATECQLPAALLTCLARVVTVVDATHLDGEDSSKGHGKHGITWDINPLRIWIMGSCWFRGSGFDGYKVGPPQL